MIEYTGFRFLLFFIAEFAHRRAPSPPSPPTLFLGGWALAGLLGHRRPAAMHVVGPLMLLVKMMVLVGARSSGCGSPTRASVRTSSSASPGRSSSRSALANIVVTGVLKVVF